MPPVKQSPNGPAPTQTSRPGSLLSRAVPVSQMTRNGIKMSLYGRAKTGKTRLLATFPKPVLIIGGEDGTASISTVPDVTFIQVIMRGQDVLLGLDGKPKPFIHLDQLGGLVEEVKGSRYATVGLDGASFLADMYLAQILGVVKLPEQKSWGMAAREQYGQQGLQMKTTLRAMLDLPQHVVIIAHERNFNDEGSSSELITPHVGSALSPGVTGWLNGAVEYICQTFIREKTVVTREALVEGAEPVELRTKTGEMEYCLRTGPHPVYHTGFRLPPTANFKLPDVIVDPTYEKIAALVRGEQYKPAAKTTAVSKPR